jgi:hypothetical protein
VHGKLETMDNLCRCAKEFGLCFIIAAFFWPQFGRLELREGKKKKNRGM